MYAPLLGSRSYKIVGALKINEDHYQCRVRVWPGSSGDDRECGGGAIPSMPVEYIWRLAHQPSFRPTCYEDDPMQQGISTGPPFGGCWLTDSVKQDDRWGRGDDPGEPVSPRGDGGVSKRLPKRALVGAR